MSVTPASKLQTGFLKCFLSTHSLRPSFDRGYHVWQSLELWELMKIPKIKLRLMFYIVLFVLLITSPPKQRTAFSPFPLLPPKAIHVLYISDKALNMFLIKILLHQRLLLKLRSSLVLVIDVILNSFLFRVLLPRTADLTNIDFTW